MKPEANAQNILSTTRATAKMHEFRVAEEDFIEMPRDPAMLFALAVGILGDVASAIADEIQDSADVQGIDTAPSPPSWGERDPTYGGPETEAATYRNTDVTIVAWCEDERSKLNLLGLSRAAGTDDFKHTRETLIRLIDEYREDWSDLDLSESDAEEMVDDLIEFLSENGDDDEDPVPNVPTGRGKLQSLDDLLRVPGGKWTHEILYDVKDPDSEDEDGRRVEVDDGDGSDGNWQRSNGIAGLSRYLSVAAESKQNPPLQINYNTAPKVLLRALFADGEADFADEMIECRRVGAGDDEDENADAGAGSPEDGGWFTGRESLACVDGLPTAPISKSAVPCIWPTPPKRPASERVTTRWAKTSSISPRSSIEVWGATSTSATGR